jgi:ribosome modulation factor
VSDKIVYVHENHESDTVTIITPKAFDALLEEGWEIQMSETKRVSGKRVMMHKLYKPSKERGLTVQPSARDERNAIMERQHTGGSDARGVIVPASNNSFLGTSDFNGLPGLKVANSMVIGHALAMGTDAANRGEPESNCPWPEGIGRTQWIKGYRMAAKAHTGGEGATNDAYEAGKLAGVGDPDLEVHCPYPSGTAHYNAWLKGFKETGGKVV